MSERDRLITVLNERSVQWGEFTLSSGRKSDLYLDGRQTSLNAEGAWLIGRQVLAALKPEVVGVGGLILGAAPIATATTMAGYAAGREVHTFLIRKQPKGHGTKQFVEGLGSLKAGDPVCVVEDTTTTGGSLLTAIERAEAVGLRVVQALVVVDRQEGAAEAIAAAGHTLEAILTREDLLG